MGVVDSDDTLLCDEGSTFLVVEPQGLTVGSDEVSGLTHKHTTSENEIEKKCFCLKRCYRMSLLLQTTLIDGVHTVVGSSSFVSDILKRPGSNIRRKQNAFETLSRFANLSAKFLSTNHLSKNVYIR